MRSMAGLAILVATACGETPSAEPNGYEGSAKIVARDQSGPHAIAVNADALYWLAGDKVVALAHGAVEPAVLASGLTAPGELCVTSSELYATTFGAGGILGGVMIPGGVARVPFAGGALETVYQPDTYGPTGIACDDAGVFWMQFWSSLTTPSGLMGLVDGRPMLIVGDVMLPHHLALDAANVYWSDGTQLMRAPRTLPLVGEAIATSPGSPERLTIHQGELFWISPSSNNGPAALLATSGSIASVSDQPTLQYSIAVDDDFVYWTEFEPGRIMRVARGGGEPEVVADGQGGPTDIALFEGAAYWTNYTTGNVVTVHE